MASSIQLLRSTIAQERPFPGNLLEGQPAVNLNSSEPGLFFKAADGSLVKFGPAAITSDGLPPNSSPKGASGNSVGELWLDKSFNPPVLRVYDGSSWVDAGSGGGGGGGGTGSFVRWIYTAIGGETSLSGSSGGVLLEYTPSLEEVFVNGVLITRGQDYSAINGTSITNLLPLQAGDVVTVLSLNPIDTIQLPGTVTLLRWTILAESGQTLLSGVDSSGQSLEYTAGFEEVYVNGAFLRRGQDYTADNDSTITLASPLTLDDEVTVMAWSTFEIGGPIDGINIIDGTVSQSKLGLGSVGGDQIIDSEITDAKISNSAAIQSSKLSFLQSGNLAQGRSVESKIRDVSSVLDFIPVSEHAAIRDGTSTYDCTASIQAAFDASLSLDGGTIYFPRGTYLVSDTLNLGFWSIAGATGNVQGFAGAKAGIHVIGEHSGRGSGRSLIKWTGPLQAGTNVQTLTDSVGSYTYISDVKPVIQVIGGAHLFFDGLSIEGDNKAYAGIALDGNFANVYIENGIISNCRIGIRITTGLRHDTYGQYYGYADSPYYKANVYNAPVVGGFRCDTFSIKNMFITGAQVGVSTESAQALAMVYQNMWVSGASAPENPNWSGVAAFVNKGGRLNLIGCGVGGSWSAASIWHVANSSTVEVQEFHDESSATYSFRSSTVPGTGTRIHFHNGDIKGINMVAGDGQVILEDVFISSGGIERTGDSSPSQTFQADIRNCNFSGGSGYALDLGTVANRDNIFVNIYNVKCPGYTVINGLNNFVGEIRNISPSFGYDKWVGTLSGRPKWLKTFASGLIKGDGVSCAFSGTKTGIDETTVPIARFKHSPGNVLRVSMNLLVQTPSATDIAASSKQIAFTYGEDTDGNVTLSPVSELNSQDILDGFVSITTVYSLSSSGGYVTLSITADNEAASSQMTVTYEGTIIGGSDGGLTSPDLFQAL